MKCAFCTTYMQLPHMKFTSHHSKGRNVYNSRNSALSRGLYTVTPQRGQGAFIGFHCYAMRYWPAGAERPARFWPAGTTETFWVSQCATRLLSNSTSNEPQTSPPQPATTKSTTKSAQQTCISPDSPKKPKTQVQIATQRKQLQQPVPRAPPQTTTDHHTFVPGGTSTSIKQEVTSFGSVKSRVDDTDSCPSDGQGDESTCPSAPCIVAPPGLQAPGFSLNPDAQVFVPQSGAHNSVVIQSYYQGLRESMTEQGFADKFLSHLTLSSGVESLAPESVIEQLKAGIETLSDGCDSLFLDGGSTVESSDLDDPSDVNLLDFVYDTVVDIASGQGDTTDWVSMRLIFDEAKRNQICSASCMDALQTWVSLNAMIVSPCKGYAKLACETL